MTGRPETGATDRREFLVRTGAVAGTVLGVAVAGCGYRPGGGDVRWRDEDAGRAVAEANTVGVAGDALFALDHETRLFDFDPGVDPDPDPVFTSGSAVDAYGTTGGRLLWDETHESEMNCSAVGGSGAAAAFGGRVRQYASGGRVWTASVPVEVRAVAAAADRVYAHGAGVLAATAAGTTRWSTETEPVSDPGPEGIAATGDLVVCADANGVVGFDPGGSRRWDRGDLSAGAVGVDAPGVLVTGPPGLVVLDPASGRTRWQVEDAAVDAVPAVGPANLYLPTRRGLVAYDHAGREQWRTSLPSVRFPSSVVADERGVFATVGDELGRFDSAAGDAGWSVEYGDIDTGPVLAPDGVLVVGDERLVCHVP